MRSCSTFSRLHWIQCGILMWKWGVNPIPSFDYSKNQFPFTSAIPTGGFLRPLPPPPQHTHTPPLKAPSPALLYSAHWPVRIFSFWGFLTNIAVWVMPSWAFVVVVFWKEITDAKKATLQNHIEKAAKETVVGNGKKMSSLLPKQGFDCCFTRGVVLFLIFQSSHSLEGKKEPQKSTLQLH